MLLLQFDALVAALPLADGGEEAQLKRIAELQVCSLELLDLVSPFFFILIFLILCNRLSLLVVTSLPSQAENDAVGQELQRQLEAAG